jgi:hypothetical protein
MQAAEPRLPVAGRHVQAQQAEGEVHLLANARRFGLGDRERLARRRPVACRRGRAPG